ncbi:unnamed protein product [Candidula unifasciata]|uniref:Guanine nucleotide-binding protein subunit beta-like protein 1 n=1 Tax=Candidula unifasciata TaxID=100452 RepID=A0A8S3ZVL9_9EUPU|nr:unnamed protein product [Candidula unifasciata]
MKSRARPAPPDPRGVMCGQSPVSSLTFGPQETYKERPAIISGHESGQIIEWSITTQRAKVSWPGHTQSVIWLAWAVPDKLLSQGRDGMVRVWTQDKNSWTCIGEIPCAQFVFCDSAVTRWNNEIKLAVPSRETSHVDVHTLDQGRLLSQTSVLTPGDSLPISDLSHTLKPPSTETYGMCMRLCTFVHRSSGPRLLVAYESGTLTLWDLLGNVLLNQVKGHEDSIMAMDYGVNPNSDMITCVTGSANEVIKTWQIDKDTFVEGPSVSVTNPGISDIAVRGDGRIFATGGWDHRVRVFSVRKCSPLAVLMYHTSSVHCVCFAPDDTLATGSKDGYIALWDVYKDK